jgi:O-antigen/teichoic acid export membrane protein
MVRLLSRGAILVLLSRYLLTPSGYGLLFLAISIIGMLFLFSVFGLPASVARYVTEYVENDTGQLRHIVRFGLVVNTLSIAIVCVVLIFARDHIASLFGEPDLAVLLLVGTGFLAARSFEKHLHALFQGFNDVRWSGLIKTVDSLAQVGFVVLLTALGFGVVAAMAGFVLAAWLGAAFGFYAFFRRYYSKYEPSPTMEPALKQRILRYSVPLTAGTVANKLDQRVDIVLVGYIMNPTAAGFYTLAKQIAESVSTPASALGFTISPQLGTHRASDNLSRARDLYETAFVHVFAVYVPAGAGMILVAPTAVTTIFGERYAGAVPAVQVFGVYTLLLALDQITNDALDYLGQARVRAIAKSVTSVANVILNIALIPVFGIVGATAATVATYSVLVAIELHVITDLLSLSVATLGKSALQTLVITAVMSGAVLALLPYVSGLLSLVAVVAIAVLIWVVMAALSGLLDVTLVRTVLS